MWPLKTVYQIIGPYYFAAGKPKRSRDKKKYKKITKHENDRNKLIWMQQKPPLMIFVNYKYQNATHLVRCVTNESKFVLLPKTLARYHMSLI